MITYEFRPPKATDELQLSLVQPQATHAGLGVKFMQAPAANETGSRPAMPIDEFHVLHPQQRTMVHHRAVQSDHLTSTANRWLHKLPIEVRPIITARRHPHVINRLCVIWDEPSVRQAYFQELLFSSRPGRRGFSFEVMDELVELQSFGLKRR